MKRAPRGWRVGTKNQTQVRNIPHGRMTWHGSFELSCGENGFAVRQQGAGVRVKWDEGIHIREGMVMEDHLHIGGSIK